MITGVVLLAPISFVLVIAISTVADREHSAWRDPISFFGSDEAPLGTAYAVSLIATGVAVVWLGVRQAREPGAISLIVAGVLAIALAALPIDCSPVDDACEVVVRAGKDSLSHDLHGYLAVCFHAALVVVIFRSTAERRGPLSVVLIVTGLLPLIGAIVRPFEPGLGALQLLSLLAATYAVNEKTLALRDGRHVV